MAFFLDYTFTKYEGKYCKNHKWFGSLESSRYKYTTLSENMDYCKSEDNCLSFYQAGCSGDKFTICMKDGHGEALDSKYSIADSSSGSCLYVKGKRQLINNFQIALIIHIDNWISKT